MSTESENIECPVCQQKFPSVHDLVDHLTQKHEEQKLEEEVSVIDKVVNAFMSMVSSRKEHVTNVSGFHTELWKPQEEGSVVVHNDEFFKMKEAYCKDRIMKTDRIIFRLEKLFCLLKDNTPKTTLQRKRLEQSVVQWEDEKEDKLCRYCVLPYSVTRRKHHCRACGGVRCEGCCVFMNLSQMYPLFCYLFNYDSPPPSFEEEDEAIRLCITCKKLIDRRLANLRVQRKESMSIGHYDQMKMAMAETKSLKDQYLEVAGVLWSAGEHHQSLEKAAVQRQTLIRHFDALKSTSNCIMSDESKDSPLTRRKIARNIQEHVNSFLRDNMLGLPSLPTPEQLVEIKKREAKQQRLKMIEKDRRERCLSPAPARVGRHGVYREQYSS